MKVSEGGYVEIHLQEVAWVNDIISAEQVTLVTDEVFSGEDEGKAREW